MIEEIKKEILSLAFKHVVGQPIVYCALNIKNGKVYIGQTTLRLCERKGSHKAAAIKHGYGAFHKALIEDGFENFEWFTIFQDNSTDKTLEMESYFIQLFNSNDEKYGYNLTTGGKNPIFNTEVSENISKSKKGKYEKENNPFFGKTHTEERKRYFSEIRKGIKPNNGFVSHSDETKAILSEKRKEWAASPENKKKLSLQNQHRLLVYCVELNKNFDSIKDAAKFFDVKYSSFKYLVRKYLKYENYTFVLSKAANQAL